MFKARGESPLLLWDLSVDHKSLLRPVKAMKFPNAWRKSTNTTLNKYKVALPKLD